MDAPHSIVPQSSNVHNLPTPPSQLPSHPQNSHPLPVSSPQFIIPQPPNAHILPIPPPPHFVVPQPPNAHTLPIPPPQQGLQHFSFTCPGLHGAGSRTAVRRMSFAQLFDAQSDTRVIIPLFQRSYCWNTTTTVPAWWRDTNKASAHSCGRLMFTQHDGAWCCLDGQQRVTTSMLLIAAARDALLRVQHSHPSFTSSASAAVEKLEAVLFVDIPAAHAFASARTPIAEGQRLLFSRLVPSFCDRRNFFELIIGGLTSHGTDEGLSETTLHSKQYDTKHYFDGQFQQIIDSSNNSAYALESVAHRAESALNVQLMMIEPQSNVNVAQVYQWLQESSLLSMGALLYNPTPGMKMHACDLTRNLFMSPWTGDPLAEQERQYALLWLTPIEIPCSNSPAQIDGVLRVLVDRHISKEQVSETEKRLLGFVTMPGFSKMDLSGLILYARVLTLWDQYDTEFRASITDDTKRQKRMAVRIMQSMQTICTEVRDGI